MKILMVLTSDDKYCVTGHKEGFCLEEFAAPYYTFLDAGAAVGVASTNGAPPPLETVSENLEGSTESARRFKQDSAAQAVLANTLALSDVRASDYDALFYSGGNGSLLDLAGDHPSIALAENFSSSGKPVGAVFHAPGVPHRNWMAFMVAEGRSTAGPNQASSKAGAETLLRFLSPEAVTGARFIERFEQVGGAHSGFRRNHAKGLGVSGFFDSNGNGVPLSKAAVFETGRMRVIGRFSLDGGRPHQPDRPHTRRGLGLQFSLPNGELWRTAMINFPLFPVRTPEIFYERLLAFEPDPARETPIPPA